jgi:phosphatidylserine/phosphatidylglycerophosphate/cardiolipin synthase-like enzyme
MTMRFKSNNTDGFQIFAVTGTNTVSFGITASNTARAGLLGFAVARLDPNKTTPEYQNGFKVFPWFTAPATAPAKPATGTNTPNETIQVSTYDHPVQSFVWDDFTLEPASRYTFYFHPLRGESKNPDRSAKAISISLETEPAFSQLEHDVFFNRGAASSQTYSREYGNKRPDQLEGQRKQKALDWLSRDLDEAILRFIRQAKKGDALRCCFYEFRYRPVADELKKAIGRGVDVRIIIDAKVNQSTDAKGVHQPSFPRQENLTMIQAAQIPDAHITRREARASSIQHNKFMVLLKGKAQQPTQVWTGSTNISMGGIHGQTNVGHWLRNPTAASQFLAYWNLLSTDPGGKKDQAGARQQNTALRQAVQTLSPAPSSIEAVPHGISTIFSPRADLNILDLYFEMVDRAKTLSCITLAFGINAALKEKLKDNTPEDHMTFLLLEKKDAPKKANPTAPTVFIALNAQHNVYEAAGSFIKTPIYQWVEETNAKLLGLNTHVNYIHSKFLLMDPLGDDPIVVTGSANFSDNSTTENDENMLIIRGDQRVADIYFTEFNRLFNHYYFRSVLNATTAAGRKPSASSLYLSETPEAWLVKYQPGSLRQKRVELYSKMKTFASITPAE